MRNSSRKRAASAIAIMGSCAFVANTGAMAQTIDAEQSHSAGSSDGSAAGDIVVTARKRDETLMSVPVAITAVTSAQLEQRGITSVDALSQLVPGLVVGEGGGTVQGGNIVLRGISGTDANAFADQAVSFNVDGVQIARSSVRRMAEMDLAQVEVLKGPQALYFGKNSPGGVVTIRTADPTRDFAGKISAGYEFDAREFKADGFISGPLTDTLGFRIAAFGSTMDGWSRNEIPASASLQPKHRRSPNQDEYAVRGTLKFDPSENFDARLKLTYSKRTGESMTANMQFVNCPYGNPQQAGVMDDCTADRRVTTSDASASFIGLDPHFDKGNFLTQEQFLAGLEMNYKLADFLTLTSVTGYYSAKIRTLSNFTLSYAPGTYLVGRNDLDIDEFSQELRLTSSFSGPVNFALGGHFQDSTIKGRIHTHYNANAPTELLDSAAEQEGMAYSIFGQATVEILPTLEISGGARYSYERKSLPYLAVDPTLSTANGPVQVTPLVSRRTFNNLSPEFSISWRPTRALTAYGSYKEGFLSGGFNWTAGATSDASFDQQLIRGFEGGVKASLLDGTLYANLALYTYEVTGLQVSVTTGGGTIQELRNAGVVRSKGAEFDFSYSPPIDGLKLNGAISYNRGRYVDYQATCYRGQNANSKIPCLVQFNRQTGSTDLLQDLSGTELARAPKFTGNVGFDYHTTISDSLVFGVGGDVTFSSSYLTDSSSIAAGRSPSYAMLGGSVRIGHPDKGWELALIGRNLTNEFFWTRSIDNPFSGTPATGDAVVGRLGDTVAAISRGREVMLRASFAF